MVRRCLISVISTLFLANTCAGNTLSLREDVLAILATSSTLGIALTSFDQNGPPDLVFDSSYGDNDRITFGPPPNGVELGLKTKLPCAESSDEKLITHYSPSGKTWNSGCMVNTDTHRSESKLDERTYLSGMDWGSRLRTSFSAFDPVTSTAKVSSAYKTFENNHALNNRGEQGIKPNRLTLSIRNISNLPAVKGWALFLCVRY